jgi:hypothetical protein
MPARPATGTRTRPASIRIHPPDRSVSAMRSARVARNLVAPAGAGIAATVEDVEPIDGEGGGDEDGGDERGDDGGVVEPVSGRVRRRTGSERSGGDQAGAGTQERTSTEVVVGHEHSSGRT